MPRFNNLAYVRLWFGLIPIQEHVARDKLVIALRGSPSGVGCSLMPGVAVKLSMFVLAGSMVLSAIGVLPPHDGGD